MRTLLLLCCSCLAAVPASAGPWVRDVGSGFAKVGTTRFQSSQGFDGQEVSGLTYRSQSLDTYVELGLGRGIQFVGSLPYMAASNTGSGDAAWRHSWTGDLRLEIDGKLHRSKPFAWGVELRVPTYRDPVDYSEAKGIDPGLLSAVGTNFPQLGDTNLDVTLKGMAGVSFSRGWFTAEAGPRFRSEGFAHGAYGALSLGVWAIPDTLGVNLYSNANVNLFGGSSTIGSRELAYIQGAVFATGVDALPGAGIQVAAGVIPVANNAARGFDLSASTFVTW